MSDPALTEREKDFSLSMALTLIEEVNRQLREAEESVRAQKEAGQIQANDAEQEQNERDGEPPADLQDKEGK